MSPKTSNAQMHAEAQGGAHCPTCRCFQVAADPWRRYGQNTTATRECSGCSATSTMPGRDGWWWRHRAPKTSGRATGRATDSICSRCAGKAGLA